MMKYKNYVAVIRYSDKDETFVGEVINTRDILVFDGTTVAEVRSSFHNVVDEYLEDCRAENKNPNKPFSGKFMVRIPPELHSRLAVSAKLSGQSLNKYLTTNLPDLVLDEAVG